MADSCLAKSDGFAKQPIDTVTVRAGLAHAA